MKDIITIRGDRELWLDFVCKVKKEKRRTDIEKYLEKLKPLNGVDTDPGFWNTDS